MFDVPFSFIPSFTGKRHVVHAFVHLTRRSRSCLRSLEHVVLVHTSVQRNFVLVHGSAQMNFSFYYLEHSFSFKLRSPSLASSQSSPPAAQVAPGGLAGQPGPAGLGHSARPAGQAGRARLGARRTQKVVPSSLFCGFGGAIWGQIPRTHLKK